MNIPAYVDSGAEFSEDRKYRYRLWRIWDSNTPYLQVIGLNPSKADEVENDPTVRRCIRFAMDLGYGGLMMTNAFAYRSTDRHAMHTHYSGIPMPTEEATNLEKIITASSDAGCVIAAWGTDHRNLFDRPKAIQQAIANLHCLKLTKQGDPGHPLYLKASSRPMQFV